MNSIAIKLVAVTVVVITLVYLISDADARGRGGRGGGGFSRGGMASHGSFGGRGNFAGRGNAAGRGNFAGSGNAGGSRLENRAPGYDERTAANKPKDRQESRQDFKNQDREDRQDHRDATREDRQANQEERRDDIDDHWDDHNRWDDNDGFVAGVVVGGAIANSRYYYSLPCSASAIYVNSINYYHCGSTWYSRGYAGSRVTYVVSSAPAGY
jgi:hypothetical protein